MTEEERKKQEYYTETGITVTHESDGSGEAWIDTTKRALIHKLVELGAREVTEQPPDSQYRSFRVPETWVRIFPSREISEKQRSTLERARLARKAGQAREEEEGPSK